MKLSNETIALIAKQLQIAILTGTDIVDNLRLLELELSSDGVNLLPTVSCVESHENNIKSMLEILEKGQASLSSEGPWS